MSRIIRGFFENGPVRTWKQLYYLADAKVGKLVGTDKFGNRYYENNEEDFGRERWVEYGNEKNPDASHIPAEWHMWMHRINEANPSNTKFAHKPFETEYVENLTGTKKNYVPYSTTKPKIEAWSPKIAQRS